MTNNKLSKKELTIVIVAALGYFVDAYDLILFVVIRKPSLLALGIAETNISSVGLSLFNIQMLGTFVGGILFGIVGDKKGRLSVLFASILLYSVANLLNGCINSLWQYYVLRFVAGVGLAGELGAGITLVSEIMPQKWRGYGTTIVASIGAFGAFSAGLVGDMFNWRISFFIGGFMGLILLFLRFNTFESKLFETTKASHVVKGDFLSLFTHFSKFKRYCSIILISLPVFFIITILMQLSPEIGKALGVIEPIKVGKAVMFVYLGLTFGDICSGLLSQYLQNRKLAIQIFLILGICITILHLTMRNINLPNLYASYIALGFGAGFWVSLITLAAEQFGTNIRATVATTIPNFARGAAIPISLMYQNILQKTSENVLYSALLTGIFCFGVAFLFTFMIKDTFSQNLDFTE